MHALILAGTLCLLEMSALARGSALYAFKTFQVYFYKSGLRLAW